MRSFYQNISPVESNSRHAWINISKDFIPFDFLLARIHLILFVWLCVAFCQNSLKCANICSSEDKQKAKSFSNYA